MTMFCVLTLNIAACGPSRAPATAAPLAPPPTLPSVTAPAVEAEKEATASEEPLIRVEKAVNAMPGSDLRTQALAGLGDVRTWWANNLAKWNAIVAQAQAQDSVATAINRAVSDRDRAIKERDDVAAALTAKVAKLEAGDPVVTRLNYAGLACLVAAVAALGVGIWLNIIALRTLSFVLGGVGLAILTLARYLHTLEFIVGGLALVAVAGAVVYLILHKKIAPAVASVRTAIAGIASDLPSPPAPASPSIGAGALAAPGGA